MKNVIYIANILIVLTLYLTGYLEKQYYYGKVSDHFDGKKFFNSDKDQRTTFDFIEWQIMRNKPEWPNKVDLPASSKVKSIVKGRNITITLVGHSTFLIQTAGYNILTDPVWSESIGPFGLGHKRVVAPAIKFEDLPQIHIILISHNHYDHLDIPTIEKLNKKFKPAIITPFGVSKAYLEDKIDKCNCIKMDWWEKEVFTPQMSIAMTPAIHWSNREIFDKNATLWGGYVIQSSAGNIYFAGDTGFGNGDIFKEIKEEFNNFQVALLPIGAYLPRWFMASEHIAPNEAIAIHQILKPKYSIAMHYNTFNLADDKYNQAVEELNNLTREMKISNFNLLNFGQAWDVNTSKANVANN